MVYRLWEKIINTRFKILINISKNKKAIKHINTNIKIEDKEFTKVFYEGGEW